VKNFIAEMHPLIFSVALYDDIYT